MSEVENSAAAPETPDVKAPIAKIDAAAEKAYAEASVKPADAPKAEATPVSASIESPEKAAVARKVAVSNKIVVAQAAVARKAAKKTVKIKAPATSMAPAIMMASDADIEAAAPFSNNPVIKLKDKIMEAAQNTDIATTAKDVFADVQTRAKTAASTAYAKSTVLGAEATEFTKANVEAVVESGKIFFAGAQNLLKDNVETGKTVIETVTEDAKKMAAVKSPTELMQLQGELVRRNFDAVISYGSKRTEAWVKLYNEAFAPITNRVSVAAEKTKTAA